ncbi:MAG: CoB--CoM heterodisulfide reductase iron-sulfur subunit A family protein [Bacteroidales bacterium]|nr:MAG: CoB--CoM heterodisulfide reductase iron-sulfur subunit A family protein [Bacteroidales bacterium]
MSIDKTKYDALVVGGGIAGQEAALSLADMDYKVLLVEKDLSIGGKMIHLSKVFPTLDCAACITTPKMSETARHPNINLLLNTNILEIEKDNGIFSIALTIRPKYVKEDLCTGCQLCEWVCPVIVDDGFNNNMVGRKAISIAFNLANPKVAAIDMNHCIKCKKCEIACVPKAIDYSMQPQNISIETKTVIISTGFNLFKPENKPQYGYGKYPNVIDAMQMDRLIAPTRPYNSVVRPGDGKIPDKIAYVLCTGSRDTSIENAIGCSVDCANNPICSQICCMYSIKQAQLLMGALPLADITIYYMDIRAFGKGYEEFYQQAKGMGVSFIKGKIAKITQKDHNSGDLILRYEDVTTGTLKEAKHDLVVLSVGVLPNNEIAKVFTNQKLELDDQRFIKQVDELLSPSLTSIEGVFVAGTAAGPKDIPDSILSAGSAASEAASYINNI